MLLLNFYFIFLGAPGRDRTGTPLIQEAADFKSAVSTNFTTGATFTLSCARKPQSLPDFYSCTWAFRPGKYEKGKHVLPFFYFLERETRLELATSTLARLRSTN